MGAVRLARAFVALALILPVVIVPSQTSAAAETYPIIFPVLGTNHFTDTFDAARTMAKDGASPTVSGKVST